MDRREAIITLRANVIYACESAGFNVATINLVTEALDLAIEALEREIEYGQMVVDFTKSEAMKSDEWKYDTTCDAESSPTTDCISRQQAIEEIALHDCTNGEVPYFTGKGVQEILNTLPPITPPKRVVAKIKVDTEELVERIKEEYQLGQKHGRLIDADKLLQELFIVDEEEWTTPEIRAILKNAPSVTPKVSEDYISRADLIESFLADNECKREEAKACMCSLDFMLELIEDAPSATPTERTGEWIKNDDYVCDQCGYHMIVGGGAYNYCPNCGAKMGGDE